MTERWDKLTGRRVELGYFDREVGDFTARCVIEMGHFDWEMGVDERWVILWEMFYRDGPF